VERFTELPQYLRPADLSPAFPASSQSPDGRLAAREAAQARAPDVAEVMRLDPREALYVHTAEVHPEGSLHTDKTIFLKYNRVYDGLPVVHGVVAVHLTRSGEIREAWTTPVHSITVPSTTPTLSGHRAGDIAVATTDWHEAVARIPTITGKRISPEAYPRRPIRAGTAPTLVVHVPFSRHITSRGEEQVYGQPALTWRTAISDGHDICEEVLIDAHHGTVLWTAPLRRA